MTGLICKKCNKKIKKDDGFHIVQGIVGDFDTGPYHWRCFDDNYNNKINEYLKESNEKN